MEPAPAVEARLIELFQYLGIARAHVAAGRMGLTDWRGLLSLYPERVASLTLVHPPILEAGMLAGMASQVLVVAGDQGISAEGAARLLVDLPTVASRILPGYACQPWSDVLADRRGEIELTILGFLNGIEQQDPAAAGTLAEEEGEVGEISYHIRGAGPPLVLLPFDLAPSQWEPLNSRAKCSLSNDYHGWAVAWHGRCPRSTRPLGLSGRSPECFGSGPDTTGRGDPRGRWRLGCRIARNRAPDR